MEINTIYLKISGRCVFNEELELGKDVSLRVDGSVVKTETLDNQNGTADLVIVVKPTAVIHNEVIKS